MNNITKAKIFAKVAHHDQKYGTNQPYFFHLDQVYQKVKQYSSDEDVLITALLHDVIEDTRYAKNNIQNFFDEKIANYCWALTDKEGKNRKERHKNTYPLISLNSKTTLVKLCDRFCNVKYSIDTNNVGKLKMYYKEHKYFKKTLYIWGEHRVLQKEIDDLFVEKKLKKTL